MLKTPGQIFLNKLVCSQKQFGDENFSVPEQCLLHGK